MQESSKPFEWAVYIIVFLVSLLLIVFSIVSHDIYPVFASVAHELGIAGIIALIVIFTIERFTRKQHEKAAHDLIDRINRNLFHAIYRRHIASDLFLEVEKSLMKSNVARSQHELVYVLNKFDEGTSGINQDVHVKCELSSKYNLKNITDHDIEHEVRMVLELPIDKSWEDHVRIKSVKIGTKILTAAEITKASTKDDVQLIFSYPLKMRPSEVINIGVDAVMVKNRMDQEVWASKLPSDGFKLTVNTPNKDFKVKAHANHSEQLQAEVQQDTIMTWKLPYGIIPNQSIVFWWIDK